MNSLESVAGKGVELYRLAEQQGMGIVAKRKAKSLLPRRRTKDWTKCKNWMDASLRCNKSNHYGSVPGFDGAAWLEPVLV